jgi:protocatechuate 4,5-dioxygenase, alpha chain
MLKSLFGRATPPAISAALIDRGTLLNRFCESLVDEVNRRAFLMGEDAYCLRYGLNREERCAVLDRNYLQLLEAGAFLIHLDRLAALSGLDALTSIRLRIAVPSSHLIAKLLLRIEE